MHIIVESGHCCVCVSGLPSWILTCSELKGRWRLFALVSSFYVFFLATCAR